MRITLFPFWATKQLLYPNQPNNYTSSRVKGTYVKYLAEVKSKKLYRMTKGNLLLIMDDKKMEIEQFIKSNKIRLKENDDYIQVIRKYNELREQRG